MMENYNQISYILYLKSYNKTKRLLRLEFS